MIDRFLFIAILLKFEGYADVVGVFNVAVVRYSSVIFEELNIPDAKPFSFPGVGVLTYSQLLIAKKKAPTISWLIVVLFSDKLSR